ncbi:MAG: hypothetical protein ACE5JH_04225 [Acidobacteriota bacterium]
MSIYFSAVVAMSALVTLEALWHGPLAASTDFLLLVVFACVAAPHTLSLGHGVRISTLQPFILAALVLVGIGEAMFVAAVSMAYFWAVGRPRLPAHKALFNLCNFVLSAWVGGHVFYAAGGRAGDVSSPGSLLALLLTVLAFFAVNTGLVSVAVALEQDIHPYRVWYEKYSWTLNAQLAGGSLTILIGMLRERLGAQVVFLTVPFCIMAYHFYRVYFSRASQGAHRT